MSLKYGGWRVTMPAPHFSRDQRNRQRTGITQTHVPTGERERKRPKEARCVTVSPNDASILSTL